MASDAGETEEGLRKACIETPPSALVNHKRNLMNLAVHFEIFLNEVGSGTVYLHISRW
jgi:hypothetical protein